ncbi:MAG TPA: nitrilase family protein [Clostridia bacterium]|nr:nitrilase family protein [Clostridia bacterium]
MSEHDVMNKGTIRLAAAQMNPQIGDYERNLLITLSMIDKAADIGAKLIILPELCNTGYAFESTQELAAAAEPVPQGRTTKAWLEKAKQNDIYIVAGIAEKEGSRIYNSAVLLGPEGFLGTYRKNHLWYNEKLLFEPGNLGFPVFELPFGRLGIQICYDFFFMEGTRILALNGADIIAVPTNWPTGSNTWDERGYCMGDYRAMVNSNANKVYIACCNRIGEERGVTFKGASIITGPNGWPLAGPAGKDSEEMLYADIDIMEGRKARLLNLDESLKDRREDLYGKLLGYNSK